MAVLRWFSFAVMVVGLAAYPVIAEETIDSETCLDCHEDLGQTLSRTAHDLEAAKTDIGLACTSCHTGANDHIDDPSVDNIGNPATSPVGEVAALCTQCHAPHAEMGNVGFDPHFNQEISCTDCHAVHSGQEMLRPDDPASMCSQCHAGVSETFARRSNHPLSDGAVTCVSCHSFTGMGEPTIGHGASANCYACHPEQSGPYVYEHPVTMSFAVEGSGCTECHDPHGSGNERLLAQKGSTLCMQCHGVPPLHRTQHSGLGTKLECMECHSEVHGSNHNAKFLDPDLGSKLFPNCYQSGCHEL